jgi:hypothetical protein
MNGETRHPLAISGHAHVWLGCGLFLLGMLNYLAPAFFDVVNETSGVTFSIGAVPLMNAGAIGGVSLITLGIGLFTHGVDEVLRRRSEIESRTSRDPEPAVRA